MNKDSPFLYQGGIFRQRRGMVQGRGPCVPTICGRCAPRPGVCAGLVAPAATDARGAAPREQVVSLGSSLPEVGAGGPHTPMRGRSAPPPRGILQGRESLLLQCRRSALHPGDFPVAGKVTKGAPGVAPLDLLRGTLRSPCSTLCCYPLKRVSATEKDRFATLSL